MEGAEQAAGFADIGEVDDAVDDEPHLVPWGYESGPEIRSHAELDEIPVKEAHRFGRAYALSVIDLFFELF
jgi:hypothetical protein